MLPLRDRLRTRRAPIVNYLLIAINVAVFVLERALIEADISPQALVGEYGLVPARLVRAPLEQSVTVLTSMFLHDPSSWFHIGGNMLFLWIFGDNVEDALGRGRYVLFYLACGLCAAMGQVIIESTSHVPMIGASGAISGVLAAYGSLYPRSPITILNPIPILWFVFGVFLEFPAWVVILEYFVVNLLSGLSSLGARGGGVAFFAHLGGFVAGLLLVRVLMAGRLLDDHQRWTGWRSPRAPPRLPAAPGSRRPPPGRRGPWDW